MATDRVRPVHVTLADHFARPNSSRCVLRIVLVSGEELTGYAPSFDPDALVLVITTAAGARRTVLPSEIQALFEQSPHWSLRAAATGAIMLFAGGFSAFLVPLLSPLSSMQGAVIGAFAGAAAAYAVSTSIGTLAPVTFARRWQRLTPPTQWHTIIPPSRRLTRA